MVWNGLTSVAETMSRDSKEYYQDGVKTLIRQLPKAYSAKIQAFTYPSVLDSLIGLRDLVPGMRLHDQRSGRFHLSYRTLIGSALEGMDHGYKLHLVYNLIANPSDRTYATLAGDDSATPLEWDVSSAASVKVSGSFTGAYHISVDSRDIDPAQLTQLEGDLYGTSDNDPQMPDLELLLNGSYF